MRWFQQVADGVSVTDVGAIYRVTQSGVSRALSRLEQEVGVPLLRRSGRTLRMTQAGAAFKRHVDAMLNDLDDGLAAVEQLVDPETGTVALAFQVSLGTWLVPELVAGFRARHPGVGFVLEQARDELVSAVLGGGRLDLEITTVRPTAEQVHWRPLFSEPLRLAVARGHPLADRQHVGVHELAGQAFVSLRPTSLLRRQVAEMCARAGFGPATAFEADDLPTVRGLVAAGLGVAVVPARDGTSPIDPVDGLVLLPLDDPAAARQIGLAWSADRRLLPAAELFRQHVLRHTPRRSRVASGASSGQGEAPTGRREERR